MLKAYKVYVLPILDYCSSVYTPHKISDINNLERIQRKFTKKALWDKSLSYENRLQKLHLSTLEVRRILSDLTLMYKILHGQIQSLSGIVNIKPSNKNTRQSRKVILEIPKYRLDIMKYSFPVHISNIWNSLPINVTQSKNITDFQKSLASVDLTPFLRGAIKSSFQPSRS